MKLTTIALLGGAGAAALLYRRGGQFAPTAGALERLRLGWNSVVGNTSPLAIGGASSSPSSALLAQNVADLQGDLL